MRRDHALDRLQNTAVHFTHIPRVNLSTGQFNQPRMTDLKKKASTDHLPKQTRSFPLSAPLSICSFCIRHEHVVSKAADDILALNALLNSPVGLLPDHQVF